LFIDREKAHHPFLMLLPGDGCFLERLLLAAETRKQTIVLEKQKLSGFNP